MGSEATAAIKPCCLASEGFVAGCARDPEGVGSSLCRGGRIGMSFFAREPLARSQGRGFASPLSPAHRSAMNSIWSPLKFVHVRVGSFS